MKFIQNQEGYSRLIAGTIILFVMVAIVLSYQLYLFSSPNAPRAPKDQIILTDESQITSIQLFPQSLPIFSDIGYLLEVRNSQGQVTPLPLFFHKEQGKLVSSAGRPIQDGIFSLPQSVSDISEIDLYLFDNSDRQNPVSIPFLQGQIKGDRAVLTYQLANFDDTTARFMLATPTDNNSLVNERSGIWFGDVIRNTTELDLPQLPVGWVYEGWAIIDDKPLTTGRFIALDEQDLFDGFSDVQTDAPDFPGEDFLFDPPVEVFPNLQFPVDLAGKKVAITIEPETRGIDPTGEQPFPLKLYERSIPALAEAGRLYDLENSSDTFPKATVVLRK